MTSHQKRKRVQYKRGKPLPPQTKYVGRPTQWGNPYKVEEHGRAESVRLYEEHLLRQLGENPNFLEPLKNFDLACYCPLHLECHADVLLKHICTHEGTLSDRSELTGQEWRQIVK